MAKKQNTTKLRVMMLGGLNEIGKNLAVLEYGNDIIIIDCGLAFPDDDMLGIDLVIPDISYLEKNADRIRGILLTHGHEDHIGALPYVLRSINPPIYGTRLTLGILQNKLAEQRLPHKVKMNTVSAGDTIKLGAFSAEFIRVNHSIADACCIAITTPVGVVLHSGDFKIDVSPIDGDMIDLTRIGEYGKKGVLLFMCESTNVGRAGFTPSERKVGTSLDLIFMNNPTKRVIVATFSSNVHRVQQIINYSAKYGRKVAITGRSMLNVVGAAVELGYMTVPDKVLIDINEIGRYKPNQITIITTGSQGEPMSALYRMAFSTHKQVDIMAGDRIIISASAIPGNEKAVSRIINELYRKGAEVVYEKSEGLHVSGHACQEELKIIHGLVRPRFFLPVHGEQRHLQIHTKLAKAMGMTPRQIHIGEIGTVFEFTGKTCKVNGTVTAGKVFVDGTGVGDVGSVVLRDRKHLAQDGMIVVCVNLSSQDGTVISGPDIITRGFIYVKESEELMDDLRTVAMEAIDRCGNKRRRDWATIKSAIKNDLSGYLYKHTKRNPMILPVIMEI